MAGKSQKIVTHPLNIESTKVRHSKLFSKFVWRSFLIFNLALGGIWSLGYASTSSSLQFFSGGSTVRLVVLI
ncbi:unnamed protein product [Cuscuta epithymum]|uniref:Photosystem I assembly protein Ycf4 n=1 Tax=Cuscuta epithymum TaxID=186058 RepID=A0AAV0C043_9ASTE|nr:unnamed protein product [Cuscuta epithymum]CAH9143397.1 unnamed protein product [Cuscuta epithymum]